MGPYLSEPVTKKSTATGKNKQLQFVAADMQGWRSTMEDAICYNTQIPGEISVFGVFDGHGGCEVSRFTAKHFVYELMNNERFKKGDAQRALVEVYKRIDDMLISPYGSEELKRIRKESSQQQNKKSSEETIATTTGCTANVVMVTPKQIFVANAGDSRAVLCRAGKAYQLSFDHKLDNEKEKARIAKAGGKIDNGRINGGLNLTRSLGDFGYKADKTLPYDQQLIICKPDITVTNRTVQDDYIVMGCDGIFDAFATNNQAIVDLINGFLRETRSLEKTVHMVLDKLLASSTQPPQPGTDNMSLVLIYFRKA